MKNVELSILINSLKAQVSVLEAKMKYEAFELRQ